MTIKFSNPGDVAAQVYNEARRDGATHEQAAVVSWQALEVAKESDSNSEPLKVED